MYLLSATAQSQITITEATMVPTDGMDTHAPALNLSIGNLNGPSELNVERVGLFPGRHRRYTVLTPYTMANFKSLIRLGKSERPQLDELWSFF